MVHKEVWKWLLYFLDGEKPNFVPVKRPSEGRIYVTNQTSILYQINNIGFSD